MANGDRMDAMQHGAPEDDEFAVRLGWGGDGDAGPADPNLTEGREGPWAAEPAGGPAADPWPAEGFDPDTAQSALQRVQVSLLDLRSDVIALRRSLRESPELQELSLSIAELRAEVAELLEMNPLAELRAEIAELREMMPLADVRTEVAEARAEIAGFAQRTAPPMPLSVLEPLLTEMGALRTDLVALKHRMAVRAGRSPDQVAEEAEVVARLVADHLAAGSTKRSRRS